MKVNGTLFAWSVLTICSIVQAFNIYNGQKYIEVEVNDTFTLVCSSQNASGLPIYINETEEKTCLNEKTTELVLNFKDVKETDTGTYTCITANGTVLSSIYVFVNNPDPDSQIFITQPQTELEADGNQLIIPCRVNRMIGDDQVRLHVQREWLHDVPYDPRKGFTIDLDRLENLKQTIFRCTYREHISQQFTYAGSPVNKRPMISAKEWSVIGEEVYAECIIKVENMSEYFFEWLPPEEDNATAVGHRVPKEGTIWTRVTIPSSTTSDEGNYTCVMRSNVTGENITSSTMFVHVGIRMGQVRVYKASYAHFDLDNNLLHFTTFVDVYGDEHEYWRNWTKYDKDSTQHTLLPEEESGVHFGIENGVHKEEISLNLSTIPNYYAYGMEIHVPFYVLKVLKNTTKMMSLRIYQNGRETDGPVDPLSEITIVCSAISKLHGAEPKMHFKSYGEEVYLEVNTTEISPTDIAFTTRIQNDAYVTCDNGFKTLQMSRHIKVLPWILVQLQITPQPDTIVYVKDIHEGDTVTLDCAALTAQIKEIEWYNEKSVRLKNLTVLDSEDEFVSIAIVKRINKGDSGVYRCVATLLDDTIIEDLLRITVIGGYHRVAKCAMPVSFTWHKDNRILCSESEFSGISVNRIGKAGFECIDKGLELDEDSDGLLYPLVLLTIIGALLVILLISTILYARGRNTELKRLRKLHSLLMEHDDIAIINRSLPLHEQVERLPYDGNYEIKLERLMITKVLSSGHYGRVYIGKLHAKNGQEVMDVAVKGPKDAAKYVHMKALVDELRIMIAIGIHPNVLCLIGAVTENIRKGDDVYVIMELCETDLKNYLLRNRETLLQQCVKKEEMEGGGQQKDYYLIPADNMLAIEENEEHESSKNSGYISLSKAGSGENAGISLISFAYQIANGMEHLAAKMCVHRDLAARNILLTKRQIVRIADFGLARQCDEKTYQVQTFTLPLPFKSMAPECISQLHFTEKSDIWSYGILLWEIFSFGDEPYKLFDDVEKLMQFHATGGRLLKPQYVPEKMSELMSECWEMAPEVRPNFSACRKKTEELLKSSSPQIHECLQSQLSNEMNVIKRYVEWRDGRKRNCPVKTGSKIVRHKPSKETSIIF